MPQYTVIYKNKTFTREKIELDGKQFKHCVFKDCLVIVERGETHLSGCSIENCQLVLRGNSYTIGQIITLFTGGGPLRVAAFDETGSFLPEGQGR
jgi:hypothetical protein